jgi:hypothetical protein
MPRSAGVAPDIGSASHPVPGPGARTVASHAPAAPSAAAAAAAPAATTAALPAETESSARVGPTPPPPSKGIVESLNHGIATRDATIRDLERRLHEAATPPIELGRLRGDLQRSELTKAELADLLSAERKARVQLEERLRSTQKKLRDARREAVTDAPTSAARRAQWPDTESWLRNEVRSAWVARVPASDKAERALPADEHWAFALDFLSSVVRLDDARLSKVLRRIVDIVTTPPGRAPGWDEHALRSGDGGDDPAVVRDDGAHCHRVEVEKNTPSARRLHYWRLPGGDVEFSSVGVHDHVAP